MSSNNANETNNTAKANQSVSKEQNCNDGRKIYVGNLPFSTSVEELVEEFSKFGNITDKQIPVIRQVLKGFAYIEYDTIESAQSAINSLNEKDFQGRQIKVDMKLEKTSPSGFLPRATRKPSRGRGGFRNRKSRENQQRSNNSEENSDHNGDIPAPRINSDNDAVDSGDDQAKTESIEFEDIDNENKRAHKPQHRGRGRGRGRNPRSRGRGRTDYRQRDNTPSLTTLYVSNIPENATQEELEEIFKGYKTTKIELMTNRDGQPRGYGFVELEDNEEQRIVLEAAQDMYIGNNQLVVKVALGQKREKHTPESGEHDNQ